MNKREYYDFLPTLYIATILIIVNGKRRYIIKKLMS